MVHQPIYCRCRGHGVLEYDLLFRERQIAGKQHAASFIAMGQQRKQDLHLISVLLNIAEVINH